jgi:hypothetical protein
LPIDLELLLVLSRASNKLDRTETQKDEKKSVFLKTIALIGGAYYHTGMEGRRGNQKLLFINTSKQRFAKA